MSVAVARDPSAAAVEPVVRPQPSPRRRVVLVAGSGRSGTSTVAGILNQLGVHVPQPEVPADETNPRGFYEPQWLVDFHTEALRRAGVQTSDSRPAAWFQAGRTETDAELRDAATQWLSDQFLEADEVVLKDPRLIWFLGAWQAAALRVGAQTAVVTMLRPPAEVVTSKRTYYGHRGEVDSVASWINLMLHTERATRGTTRAFVGYHDLLDDWTVPMARLGEAFGLQAVNHASAAKIHRVHRFVDPNLHRVDVGWEGLRIPGQLRDLADEAWELLNKLREVDEPAVHTALDDVRQRYVDYYSDAEAVAMSSVLAAKSKLERVARRRDELKERKDRIAARRDELKSKNAELRDQLREQRRRIAELQAAAEARPSVRARRRVGRIVRRRRDS